MDALLCSAIVFRALTRKNWLNRETGTVLPSAFLRRPEPKDEGGLSVDTDLPESCTGPFRETFGVVSLHVGRIRDLKLDVIVDDAPHANITGAPRTESDPGRAEWIASQLAKQARLVHKS